MGHRPVATLADDGVALGWVGHGHRGRGYRWHTSAFDLVFTSERVTCDGIRR